jgi:hypothetical protein
MKMGGFFGAPGMGANYRVIVSNKQNKAQNYPKLDAVDLTGGNTHRKSIKKFTIPNLPGL